MNPNQKLNEILSEIDPTKLSKAKQSVSKLLEGENGEKLKQRLAAMDKDKLINDFMKLDNKEIKNLVKKANLNSFDEPEIENILKKMKQR